VYDAQIIADSVSPVGVRLTTMQVTFPRIVLPEWNTHRDLSRNSQSSRARPLAKTIADVLADPFIPDEWGRNQSGMQAGSEIDDPDAVEARWRAALSDMVGHAQFLGELGVHKQLANRLLEPFMWHTVLCTATNWANLFALRVHPDAQPEIRRAARLALRAYLDSSPRPVGYDEWHLPLLSADELTEARRDPRRWRQISTGRCARVSYLTHLGARDLGADVELHGRLLDSRHLSPFEHVARPLPPSEGGAEGMSGNFRGWHQYRKDVPFEDNYAAALGVDDLTELLLAE
jgi:thymidylate synthase ThyX